MRILSVSNCPLDPTQGSGHVITGSANRLRARGHEVMMLGPSDYEWMPRLRAGKRLRMLCGYSAATLRALRRENFDVVELWGAEAWWVTTRLSRREQRPLLIARSNGLEPHFAAELARQGEAPRMNLAGRCFDRMQRAERAFCRADGLTLVSNWDRRFALEQHYQPAERLLTIEAPLSENWLGQSPVGECGRVVGFVGSWLPNKGGELLAAAMTPLLRAHADWRLRFVGVGALDATRVFPADVVKQVEIIPRVNERERLLRVYREMAIVAMPSAYESFGLVGAEAMACGCALVASRTGFAADLRNAVEAMIVTERTPAAWGAAIGALMTNEDDRRRIARAGQARVQSLEWGGAIGRLVEFYEQLSEARRTCGS